MSSAFYEQIKQQIEEVKAEGLYKSERVITSQPVSYTHLRAH